MTVVSPAILANGKDCLEKFLLSGFYYSYTFEDNHELEHASSSRNERYAGALFPVFRMNGKGVFVASSHDDLSTK